MASRAIFRTSSKTRSPTRSSPPAMSSVSSDRAAPGRVPLLAILGVFAKIGLMSFGGALSGWMHRAIVVRRQWMAEEDFLSGLALGQIMPGANVANLSLYIGQRLRGGIGAVAALLGMLLPPMIVVLALGMLCERVAGILSLHRFIAGVAAAAIGFTILVGIKASPRGAGGGRPGALPLVAVR